MKLNQVLKTVRRLNQKISKLEKERNEVTESYIKDANMGLEEFNRVYVQFEKEENESEVK